MINFFSFPLETHIWITFILGLGVISQTLALILNFYSERLDPRNLFKNLLEIAVLGEILLFSLLHGQIVNGLQTGFVIPAGYDRARVGFFMVTTVLTVVVYYLDQKLSSLSASFAAAVSLPIMESWLGSLFPWVFIGAIVFFLVRSLKIVIVSVAAIRINISALSVKRAIDTLHTGVLFSETDGSILLSNQQMQKLMITITGRIYRNGIRFYEELISDRHEANCKKTELDEQIVFLLPDDTAWMVTKTDVLVKNRKYLHLSIADITELWVLTERLQRQELTLREKSAELKETMKNLHVLSKKKEIEQAKMRAHDILGQRLSVLLRIIQTEKTLDFDLLTSLSKGLLAELKAEQTERKPYDEVNNIKQIFAAIGVNITFEGDFPPDQEQARLFVDIIREGSTNAVRHGFATAIDIKAESIDNNHNLTIKNNGHSNPTPITLGSGIRLMKKKVMAQGGTLEITQKPLFTLSVNLPGGEIYV